MKIEAFDNPFRHWLIRDSDLPFAGLTVPPPESSCWVRYENDCEMHKRTSEGMAGLGGGWPCLFNRLNGLAAELEQITGVLPLQADLYGAGLHVTDAGGWLQPHLDYNIHPQSGMERRVNLLLFLSPGWKTEWGGGLELYDDAGRNLLKRVRPEYGTLAVWEAGDAAFHGTQPTTPDAPPRVTAAVYYLSTPRPGITPRKRALFVPCRWRKA